MNQRLITSNARWTCTTDYNRRSIAETAMYRIKQLLGESLTLRDDDRQVEEVLTMARALNKMTKADMSERKDTEMFSHCIPIYPHVRIIVPLHYVFIMVS